ncbi:MAG: glycosyltransferase family 2 protein [Chloroflexi bacterium]|nr:glycosyltransferase family 2 protein [Chloroflexota bacterium]
MKLRETEVSLDEQQVPHTLVGKIVAAIPCFNTEAHIGDVVTRTRKHVDLVIVVDDGSADATAEAAKSAGAVVVRHNTNNGYGEAIRSCFEAASTFGASILVTIDGDGQHDPDEIPELLAPLLSGKADLVIGSRFLENGHAMPTYRKFGINVITLLFNAGSRVGVSDSQSGFRAYDERAFQNLSLSETGMSVSIETLEKARRRGAVISEVPISCQYNSHTPTMKAVKHGVSVALSVFKIRLKSKLGRYR